MNNKYQHKYKYKQNQFICFDSYSSLLVNENIRKGEEVRMVACSNYWPPQNKTTMYLLTIIWNGDTWYVNNHTRIDDYLLFNTLTKKPL